MGNCCCLKNSVNKRLVEESPEGTLYCKPYENIIKQETKRYIIPNKKINKNIIRLSPDGENIYVSSDSTPSTPIGSFQ